MVAPVERWEVVTDFLMTLHYSQDCDTGEWVKINQNCGTSFVNDRSNISYNVFHFYAAGSARQRDV
jgi:hypothetical protein